MSEPDCSPIMGNLHVYRLDEAGHGDGRIAVWKPRGNPAGRILYYENVTYLQNGFTRESWRGIFPFYEGGTYVGEATLSNDVPHLQDWENARYVISNTWGPVLSDHLITNPADLDTPLYCPEDWA